MSNSSRAEEENQRFGFWSLIATQFQGAFSDNAFKNLVIFLIVGMATLFSTQLVLVDGVARSLADIIYTNIPAARRRELSWWYLVFAGSWIVMGCAVTGVMESFQVTNLGFIFNAAYMGGFAMAIYVPVNLYMNIRYLPASARPGVICILMGSIASLVYLGFAISSILWELGVF